MVLQLVSGVAELSADAGISAILPRHTHRLGALLWAFNRGKRVILPSVRQKPAVEQSLRLWEGMTFGGMTNLIRWQWSEYRATHQNRTNLLIHLIAVPLFMAATVMAVFALVSLSLFALVVSMLCLVLSLIMQRIGHQREPLQPEPFRGGVNFACRIVIEQWITFPHLS